MSGKPIQLPDFVKAEIAGLETDAVIAIINALTPETRQEVVYSLFATHVQDAQSDGGLAGLIGEALDAAAIGVFTIENNGVTRWRSTHNAEHPKASLVAELIDILDSSIEGTLSDVAAKFGAVRIKRPTGPVS